MPEAVLFSYPHPKAVGLVLDPKERATVLELVERTPAAKAGFKTGDVIQTPGGQPLLSVADVQWMLHRTAPEGGTVKAWVLQGGSPADAALILPAGGGPATCRGGRVRGACGGRPWAASCWRGSRQTPGRRAWARTAWPSE